MTTNRLLIIEDKFDNLIHAYIAATKRGYEADLSCDLESALRLIDSRNYSGIITDMTFQEKGINESSDEHNFASIFLHKKMGIMTWAEEYCNSKNESTSKDALKTIEQYNGLPQKVLNAYDEALSKSELRVITKWPGESIERKAVESYGETSQNLRQEVIKNSQEFTLDDLSEDLIGWDLHVKKADYFDIVKYNGKDTELILSASNPALGYIIIKEGQKKNIPLAVVTSTSHANHVIPALLGTGITTKQEIIEHFNKKAREIIYYTKSRRLTDGGNDLCKSEGFAILDKIIFSSYKSVDCFDYPIDILEGKINETRPYLLK